MDLPEMPESDDEHPSIDDVMGQVFGGSFGDMFEGVLHAMKSQGTDASATRQLAVTIATGGESEPNVDPTVRMEYESLARVAELHVADRTGLPAGRKGSVTIEPVTKAVWTARMVDTLQPLLKRVSGSLHAAPDTHHEPEAEVGNDPMSAWISSLVKAIAPLMSSLTTGTMVGRLGSRSLGSYDLPIPGDPTSPDADRVMLIVPSIEAFATDWSIPAADLRLWVCLHELTHHSVLSVPHVGDSLTDLLIRHAGAFHNDPTELQQHLGEIDLMAGPDSITQLQQILDPEMLLGAVRSPDQEALLPRIESLVAVLIGYVDHVMDEIGSRLISTYPMVTEALRRRRVETSGADRFVERILGLNLTQKQIDRGNNFISGVVERASPEALKRLWTEKAHLPTPNEVDAPGLWLARIDLDDDPDSLETLGA
jgi:putative hydrolase